MPVVCHLSVCFTFSSSSPEPLGQFQPNLAQSIFGWREFKFIQMKGPTLFPRGDNYKIAKIFWRNLKVLPLGEWNSSLFNWRAMLFSKGRKYWRNLKIFFSRMLGIRCEYHRSSEMTIIKGRPVSQWVRHVKEPHCSIAMSAEHRSKFAALYRQWWNLQWVKILDWDDKLQTNKQNISLKMDIEEIYQYLQLIIILM